MLTISISYSRYRFTIQNDKAETLVLFDKIEMKLGGSYLISISVADRTKPLGAKPTKDDFIIRLHTITQESSLHMFWLLPQYVIITAGEIMFSITGLEFSYSQVIQLELNSELRHPSKMNTKCRAQI